MVISLCPPVAVEETANSVRACGFTGVFVEANAISPERADRIAAGMAGHRARVVDGCVIGLPPVGSVATHLYPSGEESAVATVAELFTGTRAGPGACPRGGGTPERGGAPLAKSPPAAPDSLTGVAAKAWRRAPEMREVSQSLAAAGLPPEMAETAATVFDPWEQDKGAQNLPLSQVLARFKDG